MRDESNRTRPTQCRAAQAIVIILIGAFKRSLRNFQTTLVYIIVGAVLSRTFGRYSKAFDQQDQEQSNLQISGSASQQLTTGEGLAQGKMAIKLLLKESPRHLGLGEVFDSAYEAT